MLARRFLWNTDEKTILTMTIVCFLSIVVGSCALALVAAIMHGFEQETRAVVQGIHPDIIINGGGQALNYSKIKELIAQDYKESVIGISPSMQGHVLIKTPDSEGISGLVILMSIDPQTETSISRLEKLIKQPAQPLTEILEGGRVLIGQSLADSLAVKPGDALTLLFSPDLGSADTISLEQHPALVGGIFKTGIEDLDAHVIFSSLDLGKTLFVDQGITQVGLKLRDSGREKQVLSSLREKLDLTIFSWKDLYPALLSALMLEKYAMFFILALIAIVASINIISLLFMYIAYKKTEIAVLRTLGFTQRDILTLFISIGVGVGLSGALVGVSLASMLSFVLNRYPLIPLPEVYYVSHLPAHMTLPISLAVVGLVVLISFLAALIPARHISSLDVAVLLKRAT